MFNDLSYCFSNTNIFLHTDIHIATHDLLIVYKNRKNSTLRFTLKFFKKKRAKN